jgi:hypothetical protein
MLSRHNNGDELIMLMLQISIYWGKVLQTLVNKESVRRISPEFRLLVFLGALLGWLLNRNE